MRRNRDCWAGVTLLSIFLLCSSVAAVSETAPSSGAANDVVRLEAGGDSRIAPIIALEVPMPSVRRANILGPRVPIEIRSEEALRAFYPEAAVQALKEKVSFDQQVLLLFVWRGPGEDRLEYRLAESHPAHVFFSYTRGQTREWRLHARLFAIRRDVRWTAPHVPRPADPILHDRPNIERPPVLRE